MPVELIRIDERLLHGQVVVGWGEALDLGWYVVVDDELAGSPWEQEIHAAGLPGGVEARFLTLAQAAEAWEELARRPGRGGVLTRDPGTMRALAREGRLEGRRVVLGPMGAGDERRRRLDYVHLSPEEERELRELARLAGEVVARDLPSSPAVGLGELLAAEEG